MENPNELDFSSEDILGCSSSIAKPGWEKFTRIVERRRNGKVDSFGDISGDEIRLNAVRRKVSSY